VTAHLKQVILAPTGADGNVVAIPVARAKMLYTKWQQHRRVLGHSASQVDEKGET